MVSPVYGTTTARLVLTFCEQIGRRLDDKSVCLLGQWKAVVTWKKLAFLRISYED